MLIHRHDEPLTDAEWRDFLKTHDFGDFIVPGAPTRDLPIVVPTHFIWDGDSPSPTSARSSRPAVTAPSSTARPSRRNSASEDVASTAKPAATPSRAERSSLPRPNGTRPPRARA